MDSFLFLHHIGFIVLKISTLIDSFHLKFHLKVSGFLIVVKADIISKLLKTKENGRYS